MLLVVGILPPIGLTSKVGFMPLLTQTLFFGNFSTFFFGRLIDPLRPDLADEVEVDFNGLRRICNAFIISLMHKNLVDIIDEIQMICEKTEALLLQGMSESEQNLFMDFLIQAGRNITSELHIERKGEEFND